MLLVSQFIFEEILYRAIFYDCLSVMFLARRSIYLETQHPDGLEKIRELESQGRPAKLEIDEPPPTAPTLTELWVIFFFFFQFGSCTKNTLFIILIGHY